MKFRFIGQHNNGATSISYGNLTWHGGEPVDVTDTEWIRRLSGHPEFEKVTDKPQLDHDGNGHAGGSKPRRKKVS